MHPQERRRLQASPGGGVVTRHDIEGRIELKTLLTGMPECKLGISDRLTMEAPP